ncbi:MAG: hypothetical protein AMS25_14940 [Gemmatimonas sp. SM23_52]|nr:MAG: hypothetical protein AMS25_14940 [Gemmatimonas sp. SM23_52]
MVEDGVEDMRQRRLRDEYTARINRVIDYIDAHIDQDLSLQTLARVASFSPYHFHRIFGALMGETLSHFIQRLRIERAATMLIHNPKKSITQVAFDCGFSGSAAFARAFREAFGMSASQWRSGGYQSDRKMGETDRNLAQMHRKGRKDFDVSIEYNGDQQLTQRWRDMRAESPLHADVEVKEIPAGRYATARFEIAGDQYGDAWNAVFGGWLPESGYQPADGPCFEIYLNDPKQHPEGKHIFDICVPVKPL